MAVWGGQAKYHMDLHFRLTSNVHAEFKKALASLDDKIIQAAADNSEEWLRQPLELQQVTAIYSSYLREDEDDTWLRVNVPFRGDKCAADVFDDHNELDTLKAGDGEGRSAVVILQPLSLWFFNQKFGIRWKVHEIHLSAKSVMQTLPTPTDSKPATFMFEDDD